MIVDNNSNITTNPPLLKEVAEWLAAAVVYSTAPIPGGAKRSGAGRGGTPPLMSLFTFNINQHKFPALSWD